MTDAPSVLLCGNFSNTGLQLSPQCAEALEALGCRVTRLDTEDHRRKFPEMLKRWSKSLAKLVGAKQRLGAYYREREIDTVMQRVREAFRATRPDWVLVIRGGMITPEVLDWMGTQGALRIMWWSKEPRTIDALEAERHHYDLTYCIHSNHIRDGIRYLPSFAVDFSRYYPAGNPHYRYDVVFVGRWNERRQRYMETLADQNLAIVGPGWERKLRGADPAGLADKVIAYFLDGDALVRLYQSARIVVNVNQWESDEAAGATLRIADVPACGPLLLTELNDGVAETFAVGAEVVTFETPEQMRAATLELLADEPRRQAIADAGLARVRRMPTYEDRMAVIVADANELIASRSAPA